MDTLEEEWRPIDQFPIYSISSLGNVQNNQTGKILKLSQKGGYYHIGLSNETDKKTFKVHRLVALAFLPNPLNKSDVNHKDKNKLNNCLTNLEWMTRAENNKHRCEGIKITSNKNKPVYRKHKTLGIILDQYNSIEDAANWIFQEGLSETTHNARNAIGNCARDKKKSSYGFAWEFVNKHEDLEGEEWRQILIPDVDLGDKTYFVSNLGRYKNSFGEIPENYKVNDNGYIRVLIASKV